MDDNSADKSDIFLKQTLANQLLASSVSLGQIVRVLNAIPMSAETRDAVQKVLNEIGDEQKELAAKIQSGGK